MKVHVVVLPILAALALGPGASASLAQWCCDGDGPYYSHRDRPPSPVDWSNDCYWHHHHCWAHHRHWCHEDDWCDDGCDDCCDDRCDDGCDEDIVVSGFWPFCTHVVIHDYCYHHGPPPWWRDEEREEHHVAPAPVAPAPEEARPAPPPVSMHKKPEG